MASKLAVAPKVGRLGEVAERGSISAEDMPPTSHIVHALLHVAMI